MGQKCGLMSLRPYVSVHCVQILICSYAHCPQELLLSWHLTCLVITHTCIFRLSLLDLRDSILFIEIHVVLGILTEIKIMLHLLNNVWRKVSITFMSDYWHSITLDKSYSKGGLLDHSWKLVRNADSQTPSRPTESEMLGSGAGHLAFKKPSRWFWHKLNFESCCFIPRIDPISKFNTTLAEFHIPLGHVVSELKAV